MMTNTTKYGIVTAAIIGAAIVASKSKGGLSGTSMKEHEKERIASDNKYWVKTNNSELLDKPRFQNYVVEVRFWTSKTDEFPQTYWFYNHKWYAWDWGNKPKNVSYFDKKKKIPTPLSKNIPYIIRRHLYGMIDEDGTILTFGR